MNQVILIGNVTRNPETVERNGVLISEYALAVNNRSKSNTNFIPCVAFAETAEFTQKYIKKGSKLCIEGRLKTESYTNKDGKKVFTMKVVVEHQEFTEKKSSAVNNYEEPEDKNQDNEVIEDLNNMLSAPSEPSPASKNNGIPDIPDSFMEGLPFH